MNTKIIFEYDEENYLLSAYYNKKLITEFVCESGNPEFEKNEIIKIFNAGQLAALSEVVFTVDDAISLVSSETDCYSQEDIELVMAELKHVQTVLLVNKANQIGED